MQAGWEQWQGARQAAAKYPELLRIICQSTLGASSRWRMRRPDTCAAPRQRAATGSGAGAPRARPGICGWAGLQGLHGLHLLVYVVGASQLRTIGWLRLQECSLQRCYFG